MDGRSESIGSVLARARRSAGLTVGQVSARTRIRESLIHALERDDFSLCGGDFYGRGHVRNIAKVVGLDPEAVVQAYDEANGGSPAPVRASAVFQADRRIRLRERRSLNWSMALAIALGIAVVFGVVRLMGGAGDVNVADIRPAPGPKVSAPPPAVPPRNAAAAGPAQSSETVVVRVKARKEAQVTARDAKGRKIFSGRLKEGASATWRAKSEIRVVFADAGAVSVHVNGKDLGVPGAEGEIVRRTYRPR
ncbi:helix-turn-helix domain-containing protein [Spongiactinospora sp. TRM90649]|uniref:helix-turn-helix domain-containing protein n=1 Tax=Spongiactinospora sp. TRM90649 TaxID=3031114 RepID=UPI0023F8759E|nr:helix-turn-helix domain-containing protein [Spongiactinospora sp. TRM90649]MDF5754023.1 DUF4115 domain-containing protein [Spongiactinospora sp. TRM90649]